ncbi:ATPase involved in chromosome partitioning [Desulfosporosinus orientis DSM 765]|uniref:ATPase involved in chromosome partitioning n=1 Tax=Desulfosporosinus orientis (strain ATCC 19365 / DSM 765 / NCIMB 8382 / VKM B-1628 / Singapore I) TaxID=768706 RepID=G7WHX7_DESOD|nr:MinD/ParA family protein [Desulfosporosinus orientis]AET70274.1 ATPase involved in chromosome partitioning [Desulfosporosinus orientis DSM 765]
MHDQASALRGLVAKDINRSPKIRVLAVTSGKGGVGKTSFTVNLALALAELEQRVVILDGDLGLANVDIAFGLSAKYTIEHLISGERTIEEILLPAPRGIEIIPGGSGVQRLANLERDKLTNVIVNLGRLDKRADLLIIDTGAGLGNNVLNFLKAADDIIMVITPEPTSLTDAYGVLKTLKQEGSEASIHAVINRVQTESDALATFKRIEIVVQKFLDSSLNYLGWVYDDPFMGRSVMQQEPLGIKFPESAAYRCIQWIAGKVIGISLHPPRKAGGVRGFLSKLLRSF